MNILSLVTSVFGGGITGLIGSITQHVLEFKTKKLELEANRDKFAHEERMVKAEAEVMAQEWAARTKVAETESAARIDVADSAAFAASFNEPARYSEHTTEKQNWFMVGLDVLRGVVRPGLTVYLCILTTLLYLKAQRLLPTDLAPDQALGLVNDIVGTILYLTTTCILWWFGTRNKAKQK